MEQNQQQVEHISEQEKIDLDDISGKIFIGGLSWQTTEQNLRYYFEKFGELTDVALMIDKRSGKPRGFGFIKLKDPAAADVVMSTEHTIDGRLVDVKRALPRDKAPGPTRNESCKIFVGGLAAEITEKEFGDYFAKFGIVKDAVVMVDRNTGRSRGFGFITFEREETIETVMKVDNQIMGKYVEIKRAEPRDARGGDVYGGGYGGFSPAYGGAPMMGGGYGGRMGGRGGAGYRGGMPVQGGGGYRGRGGMEGGDYGQQAGYGADPYMRGGYAAGPAVRYPAGYGGARGSGPSSPMAAAGYSNPYQQQQQPQQQQMPYYGGAPMAAAAAGAGGYYGAGGAGGYGGAVSAYGGVQQVEADALKGGYDNNAIAAGYANAAAMQMRAQQQYAYSSAAQQQQQQHQQQPQLPAAGGAQMAAAGYGGYGVYSNAPGPTGAGNPQAGGVPVGAGPYGPGGPVVDNGASNAQYGAFRGQGAVQGRVDRSYRPY